MSKKMQSSIVDDVSMIKPCQAVLSEEVNAKYTELSRSLADCVSRVGVHEDALEDCKTSLDGINSRISNVERSIAEIKASQVRNEADFGISTGSVSCVSEVIDELSEQQKRATNIMVFGAREDTGVPKRDRGQVDQRFVVDLFKFLVGDNAPDIKSVFRLGSLQAGRTRPLKVVLSSERSVHLIIKNAAKLKSSEGYKDVAVAFDRTFKQREAFNKLRGELRARLQSGEDGLKIRFVNGAPRIVKLN